MQNDSVWHRKWPIVWEERITYIWKPPGVCRPLEATEVVVVVVAVVVGTREVLAKGWVCLSDPRASHQFVSRRGRGRTGAPLLVASWSLYDHGRRFFVAKERWFILLFRRILLSSCHEKISLIIATPLNDTAKVYVWLTLGDCTLAEENRWVPVWRVKNMRLLTRWVTF